MQTAHPVAPEIGVISLVPEFYWDSRWMSRHQILTRLARYFWVVWVSRARGWREILKGEGPPKEKAPLPESLPSFFVYDPEFWLPQLYRPQWLADFTLRTRLHRAEKILRRQGAKKIVLHVWRPDYRRALDCRPWDVSCYHVVDEYTFSEVDLPTPPDEQHLLAKSDEVFITTKRLWEKKKSASPHVTLVPSGVDFLAFATPRAEPADLASIPRPRIGYAGYLKKTLDWDLLRNLISHHPEWQFVFIGPVKYTHELDLNPIISELSARPNVHFLGARPSQELPAYVQHFDVGLLPYKLTDYANYGDPLKLYEYLAAGIPSVGCTMPTLLEFTSVVSLAGSSEQWSTAIAGSLSAEARTPERRAARQRVARQYDWGLLTARIAHRIAIHFGTDCEQRVRQLAESIGADLLETRR